MHRPRRILDVLLAFALILNGSAGAYAAAPGEGMLNTGDPVTNGEPAPCHGDSTTTSDSSPDSEPSTSSLPDCCEFDACVCSITASFVASTGIVTSDLRSPEHRDSSGALEQGHAFPALNLLLRPPNS